MTVSQGTMMRVLLLADIHANWPALRAVAEVPHDLCICLGDLVDYGMTPAPCIDWVRRQARFIVRGNHDHGVAQDVTAVGTSSYRYLTAVTRPPTIQMLSAEDRRWLGQLPLTMAVTIDEVRLLLVHATPRDPLEEYAFADADFWGRRLAGLDADVLCVGHSHLPFVLDIDGRRVINPGSVGLPRDGDPRASVAVLEGRKVEHLRIAYDQEEAVAAVQASALPEPAQAMLAELYRTGDLKGPRTARPPE